MFLILLLSCVTTGKDTGACSDPPLLEVFQPTIGQKYIVGDTVFFDASTINPCDISSPPQVDIYVDAAIYQSNLTPSPTGRVKQEIVGLAAGVHSIEAVSKNVNGMENNAVIAISFHEDVDGDGQTEEDGDCDDTDPTTYLGSIELCSDGKDNDCDRETDESPDQDGDGVNLCDECDDLDSSIGSISIWYYDDDSDGYGDPSSFQEACTQPAYYVANNSDCNDSAARVHPGAEEVCDDDDNDCDGETNEGILSLDWYPDADGDGHGDPGGSVIEHCDHPAFGTFSTAADDCDDTNATIYTGAAELCDAFDNDCDGGIDDVDADADTLTICDDCDDSDPSVGSQQVWYTDTDGDGFGIGEGSEPTCETPANSATTYGDCDDTLSAVHPAASEFCDNLDNDCDTEIDEDAVDAIPYYLDADTDNYGDPATELFACNAPDGYIMDNTDCNDANDNIGASTSWYRDVDGDTYGNTADMLAVCPGMGTAGYVLDPGDCDDVNALVNPGATEICDADDVDEDCDDVADDEDDGVAPETFLMFYADDDVDGYGDPGDIGWSCDLRDGYQANDQDCDDSRSDINPGMTEICDSANTDEDCDNLADDADSSVEASTYSVWYADSDNDGSTDPADSLNACDEPDGYSVLSAEDDCDDTREDVYPGREEICDDIDNNCDGVVNENDADSYDNDEIGFAEDLGESGGGGWSVTVSDANLHNTNDIDWFMWADTDGYSSRHITLDNLPTGTYLFEWYNSDGYTILSSTLNVEVAGVENLDVSSSDIVSPFYFSIQRIAWPTLVDDSQCAAYTLTVSTE